MNKYFKPKCEHNNFLFYVFVAVIRRALSGISVLAATKKLRLQWLKHSAGGYSGWAQFIDFINQFCHRSFRFHLESAKAAECNDEPKWERKLGAFDEIVLASGAHWFRNANGFWHLVKSQVPKNQPAVLEFLDNYDVTRLIHNLQALVDFGFGLPIQYLDKSYYAEECESNFDCEEEVGKDVGDSIRCDSGKNS